MNSKAFQSKTKELFASVLVMCCLLFASSITYIFTAGLAKTIFLVAIIVFSLITIVLSVIQIANIAKYAAANKIDKSDK